MLGTLLRTIAYSKAPGATFQAEHPRTAANLKKVRPDLRNAYAPRLVVVATALVVAPLAYRIGRRMAAESLRRSTPAAPGSRARTVQTALPF
jgi:hypothetical protein